MHMRPKESTPDLPSSSLGLQCFVVVVAPVRPVIHRASGGILYISLVTSHYHHHHHRRRHFGTAAASTYRRSRSSRQTPLC